jgi:hypothetical protein
LSLCLLLVLKVGVLELGADIKGDSELVVSLLCLLGLDEVEDSKAVDGISTPDDDGVADFSDQDDESRWGIVVLRILPNKQDRLHDWSKEINYFRKICACADQIIEEICECSQVLIVLNSLVTGDLYFFLELAEWTSVG